METFFDLAQKRRSTRTFLDKPVPQEIQGHMYVFVIDKEIFFVDEHDFPEVAEMMDRLYFGEE